MQDRRARRRRPWRAAARVERRRRAWRRIGIGGLDVRVERRHAARAGGLRTGEEEAADEGLWGFGRWVPACLVVVWCVRGGRPTFLRRLASTFLRRRGVRAAQQEKCPWAARNGQDRAEII